MKAIKITSKLTSTERRRIDRQIARQANAYVLTGEAFEKIAPMTFAPVTDAEPTGTYGEFEIATDPHRLARNLMTIAGRTFDYEVVEA